MSSMFEKSHARHDPNFNPFNMDPTPGPGEVNIYDPLTRLRSILKDEDLLVYEFAEMLAEQLMDRPVRPEALAAWTTVVLEWLENGEEKRCIPADVAKKWKNKESFQELIRERLPVMLEVLCDKDFGDKAKKLLGV